MSLRIKITFALATLTSFTGCSAEKKSDDPSPPSPKTSPSRVRAAQELLSKCAVIEPRIAACDRLQAVVTRDDAVPASSTAAPKTPTEAPSVPFNPKGPAEPTPIERAKHARSMLGQLRAIATTGMRELEESAPATRDAIVARLSMEIEHASKEILTVSGQLSSATRSSLLADSDAAANAVLEVETWIASRRPNAAMMNTIRSSITHLDTALAQLGVVSVGQRPMPTMKTREVEEAQKEASQAYADTENLKDSISAELDYRKAEQRNR